MKKLALLILALSVLFCNSVYAQTFDLASTWFDTQNLTGNVLNNDNVTTIDFSNFHPTGQQSNYSVRIEGFIQATTTGLYTFETRSDDGVRLFVDSVNIIDNYINQGATDRTGTISLTAGQWYPILLEHFQDGGAQRLRLRWAPPGESLSFPPATVLSRFLDPEIDVSSSETGVLTDGGIDNHNNEPAGVAKTVTYTISNTDSGPLDVTTATSFGASNVSVNAITGPVISTIPSGGSTTFTITYTPTIDGTFSFGISFTNNDPDEDPFDFTVTGMATGATGVCTGTNLLVNGSFETPDVPGSNAYFIFSDALVPGWSSSTGDIEIWDNGHDGGGGPVASYSGAQHAEINANTPGTMMASGSASGRSELLIGWYHQARVTAAETASLTISDDQGGNSVFGNFTSSVGSWTQYSTTHVTAANASNFDISFSTTIGGALGNFLDLIEACQTYITLGKAEQSRQDIDTSGGDSAGDTITYRFTISNPSGNVRSLGSIRVIDDQLGTVNISVPDSGDTNANGLLEPGETWIVDLAYTLTQVDLNSGSVVNVAYAEGATVDNVLRSDDQTVTANLATNPSLSITKTSDKTTDVAAGEIITYTYTVLNNGNQTITGIAVSDVHNGTGAPPAPGSEAISNDSAPTGDSTDAAENGVWDSLAPGDEVTFTATYTVTQQDIDTLR